MSISRVHTWSAGEVLSALDLNTEINNILNNSTDLVFPINKSISLGGFTLYFDATQIMGMTYSAKGINLSTTTANNETITTVASATTPDIWTGVGNVVSYTGTVTATGFAAAPQAGARRILYCTGAAPFTAGANVLIDGYVSGATYTATAGDKVEIIALTTTQFNLLPSGHNAPTFVSINDGPLYGNRIINGNKDYAQWGTSATITAGTGVPTASAGYPTVDMFYSYCTGANVAVAQVNGANAQSKRTQYTGAASVTAIGEGHRIEALNSYDMAGQTCRFTVELANSLLTTVTWTANYATTTDAFGTVGTATKTQIATGTFTVTSTVTSYGVTISVPSAAITGIEIVLTVGAQTSGTWTVGSWDFRPGTASPTYFDHRPNELQLIQKYFCKSWDFDTAIGTATFVGAIGCAGTGAGQGEAWNIRFPVSMRSVPVVVQYSPGTGTSGQIRNVTGAADAAATAVSPGKNGYNNAGVGLTLANVYILHYTASAMIP
jgi:hypothetical protein